MPEATPSEPRLIPKTLWEAIAAFQFNLPTVGKDNEADTGKYKYKYTDLTSLTEIALPLLLAQGLTWTTAPTVLDGQAVLHYELAHASGDKIAGDFPLGAANQPPQSLGSAITYARRYALCAVTGIAPGGEDDDGKTASTPPPAAAPATPSVGTPPDGWRALLADVTTVDELQALYDDTARHWYTDEVKLAFKARKAAIT